jgi:hypothetical protein
MDDRDQPHEGTWAAPVTRLRATDVPQGAYSLNINGRQVTSPLQGFGQLWRKTYRIRMSGSQATAVEVMQTWKADFPSFLPSFSPFYPSMAGVKPGEILFITAPLPIWPGSPGIIPMSTGVMVLYVDDEMFTVMTPEGHPEAGWNTFSVYEEEGGVVAQVEGMVRANDPIYEIGFRFLGGSAMSDKTWIYVLQSVAARFGVSGQEVMIRKDCLDQRLQWRYARNVWQNAAIRTMLYVVTAPLRRLGRKDYRRSSAGR